MVKKKVALIFLPSDSGVDGARSLYGEERESGFAGWMNGTVRNLIKRTQFAIPPLSLMILGSIDVPGVEQSLFDLRFEPFPADGGWDLVGIGVQTGMAARAFDLADSIRRRGVRVVLGGPHATLFPESCRSHADIIVHGEAEELWKELLDDLVRDGLKTDYRSESLPDLSASLPVRKSMLRKNRYFTTNLVQTGRGCPYQCDFCNVHVLNGRKIRKRRITDLVDEVRRFREDDRRIFFFVDDSINADPSFALDLFRKLEPLRITWFGQATTALGQQPELLEAFSRSGCRALLVGIESIEPSSRSAHGKVQNRSGELYRNIMAIRESGISLYGSFIYGLDGDTLETPRAIIDFARSTGIDVPGINILRPTPGTRVFDRLREEGRLLFDPEDITAFRYTFGQEMLYLPKQIPLDDFIASYSELTRALFNVRSSVQRGMAAPSVKAAVLLFNLFYTHLYGLSRNDLRRQVETIGSRKIDFEGSGNMITI